MINLLQAVHGKGFDHEIVDSDGHQVAKVFAWESNSFELAQLLASSFALLTALEAADAALRHHPGGDTRSNDDAQLAMLAIAQAKGRTV